jgi:hypothetical protein
MAASAPDVLFARGLLAVLIPVALAAPMRWAVAAWLVMTNLDASGSGGPATAQVGWLNAVKAVALPGWLLLRLRRVPGRLESSLGGRAWLLLAIYAGLSALWSEFPLAGAKLAAGMAGILLAGMALERAARTGALEQGLILRFLAASLGLALFQTVFFADGSFGFAGRGMPQRLTSFVSAQQFAALLAALLAWLLWVPKVRPGLRTALGLGLFAALAANGSRTWSAGALVILLIHTVTCRRDLAGFLRVAAAVLLLVSVPAVRRGLAKQPAAEPANRLTATASALLTGQDRADGMGLGTARFRLAMYRGVMEAMSRNTASQWIFGRGSASGGRLGLELFPYAYRAESLDANRVIHNEWLRAAYEWGAIGELLWACTLGATAVFAWRQRRRPEGAALLAYLPAFLLGASAENVMDGAGNAVTAGLLVLVALALAAGREESRG